MIEFADDSRQLIGRFALDRNCSKIGTIGDVYVADQTGRPEWLVVSIAAPDRDVRFVPLGGAQVYGDDVVIPYDASTVKNAPHLDADGRLELDSGLALFRHYGLPDPRRTGGMPRPPGGQIETPLRDCDDFGVM